MRPAATAASLLAPLLLLLLAPARAAQAYEASGSRWPGSSTTFRVSILSSEGATDLETGIAWDTAFEDAMARWGDATPFEYFIVDAYSDPCSLVDTANGVDFATTACGDSFGFGGLAVTLTFAEGAVTTETDVVFNDAEAWSIYSGAHDPFVADFSRVALHELGHALGLGHEPELPAIMNTPVGSIETLQPDDRSGADALYGPCPAGSPLAPGDERAGTLAVTDCFASELGLDALHVLMDRYALDLPEGGRLAVELRSSDFDAFLVLFAGEGGAEIARDDDAGPGTDARLELELAAGSYLLGATSFGEGEAGAYALSTSLVPEPERARGALAALGALGLLALRRPGARPAAASMEPGRIRREPTEGEGS